MPDGPSSLLPSAEGQLGAVNGDLLTAFDAAV